jgi:hypothetical protein
MEVVHFVLFIDACGGKKSRLSQLMFHLFFFCLFFAEGVYKLDRRASASIFRFSFFIFHFSFLVSCGAYIDLNAVRANIVEKPEDYRWCSLGMRVRAPKQARRLLTWFPVSHW